MVFDIVTRWRVGGRPRGEQRRHGRKRHRAASFGPCRFEASGQPIPLGRTWAQSGDEPLVALVGLSGDLHLLFPQGLDVVGVGGPAPVVLLLRPAGLQLHRTHLFLFMKLSAAGGAPGGLQATRMRDRSYQVLCRHHGQECQCRRHAASSTQHDPQTVLPDMPDHEPLSGWGHSPAPVRCVPAPALRTIVRQKPREHQRLACPLPSPPPRPVPPTLSCRGPGDRYRNKHAALRALNRYL